jgi:hypothetical protein
MRTHAYVSHDSRRNVPPPNHVLSGTLPPLVGLPSDGGDDLVGVGTYRGEVVPALFVLAIEVHGSGSSEDWLMLRRKLLERPGRSRILRLDLLGFQRRPDLDQGEQNAAGVGLKIAEQARPAPR